MLPDYIIERYGEDAVAACAAEVEEAGYDLTMWEALCEHDNYLFSAKDMAESNPQYVDNLGDWAEALCRDVYSRELSQLPAFIECYIDWDEVARNGLLFAGDYSYADSPDLACGAFIVWRNL